MCGISVPKIHLVEHINVMHQAFSCSQCDGKFQSKISLKRHTIEAHSKFKPKKRHFCPLCSKDYDYRKQLEDHIRSFHDKERNAQCHICHKSKNFSYRKLNIEFIYFDFLAFYHRDLKKHIGENSEKLWHHQPLTDLFAFSEHVHGDKNISCETCGKLFTCIENLRLHMRYHLPPSYACTYAGCNKKFHQKVLWEHHEKKHSDVKPFICETCNSAYYSLRDLKRHNSRVHEKVIRSCLLCESQFTRKDKYRLHLLKRHTELSELDREDILNQIRVMKWNETWILFLLMDVNII